MRPSDLLAKGGHRRLLERAKRVPSRGCGQFAEPLPQLGRELKAKFRCLELRAKAWSREMRGHGYPHHPMSSVAMGRFSGGMDVDDGFGGGLTMTGHGWNPLATSEGRIGGERKVPQVACPRLQGRKSFVGEATNKRWGGGGLGKSGENLPPSQVHHPRVWHLPSPDLARADRFLTNTSQESWRDMGRKVGTQGTTHLDNWDEIGRGWVGPARE